jgi:hypothetical protein
MKRIIRLLPIVFMLVLLPAMAVQAKQPLYGTTYFEFNLGLFDVGLQDEVCAWVGTITLDGEEYGAVWWNIGSGKAFDDQFKGKISFFEETWAIYDTDFDFTSLLPSNDPADWAYWLPINNPAELVLRGNDKGQTNGQTSAYHMSGTVEEAFGIFTMWEGRSLHMSGIIIWYDFGAPHFGPGIIRIN